MHVTALGADRQDPPCIASSMAKLGTRSRKRDIFLDAS